MRVINERHEREQRLAYLSRFDALTGEMNRWHLTEVLEATVEEAVKLRSSCGFLLVAIDNLGRINEAYGFEVADEVIAAVAKRLRSQLRGKDHLGRLSGNKFGIILKNCTPDDMLIAADRLLAGVRDEVVQTAAGPVAVTVTIGGVTAPRHARNVREVLSRAQDALDSAKAKRRGSFQAYQPNLEREAQRRDNVRATDEIITALNDAAHLAGLRAGGRRIGSRQPAFYECLMRVRRADGTLAGGERGGAGRRAPRPRPPARSSRARARARRSSSRRRACSASLNVSAASTVDPDWWAALGAMLKAHAGVGERLTVEITETAAIQDIDDTRGFVARVKDLGCRIAIDDFGAGYTSFRNLRKLGVDMVKIDGAFVQNLTRSEDDRAFVHTLIDLARRLGLETVAEWVQDEEAAAMLADWGCDYLQGALIGLASPERPWLGARQAAAAAVGVSAQVLSLSLRRSRRFCISSIWRLRSSISSPPRGCASPLSASPACALAPRERREHREGALEHLHVAADLVLERAERAAAEGLRHLVAELLLLAGERVDRDFEIARHQHLHAVAVEADQLAQECDRQQVLPLLVLLLEDDLGQHRAGDVLAGLGVVDDEILARLHHDGEVFERHIGAGAGVVEPPVGVFLDGDRFFGLGHDELGSRRLREQHSRFLRNGHRFVTLPPRRARAPVCLSACIAAGQIGHPSN